MDKYKEYYPHGIMFHRFHQDKQYGGSISPQNLENIINMIDTRRILTPAEWIDKCINNSLDDKDICLTFDDCLKSQYQIALPILQKYKLKAFFFVHSITFDNNYEYNELFFTLIKDNYESFDIFFDQYLKYMNINHDIFISNKFNDFKDKLIAHHNHYSENEIKYRFLRNIYFKMDKFIDSVKSFFSNEIMQLDKKIWMTSNEVEHLSKLGHYIGLHTHSHFTNFLSLNYGEQKKEYQVNKDKLESIIDKKIYASSHPLGLYNDDTLTILKELDIVCAFRSNNQIPEGKKIKNPNNYELARNDVSNINYN